jgi:quercetin dioxygenase-like cupin family protein
MREPKRGHEEIVHRRGNYLVRRLRLAPGEATAWHRDPFQRVSVVVSGDHLEIEFRDGGQTQPWIMTAGEVNWLEPSDQVHRAVNVGSKVFEEVTTFFLDRQDAVPQPEAEEH